MIVERWSFGRDDLRLPRRSVDPVQVAMVRIAKRPLRDRRPPGPIESGFGPKDAEG